MATSDSVEKFRPVESSINALYEWMCSNRKYGSQTAQNQMFRVDIFNFVGGKFPTNVDYFIWHCFFLSLRFQTRQEEEVLRFFKASFLQSFRFLYLFAFPLNGDESPRSYSVHKATTNVTAGFVDHFRQKIPDYLLAVEFFEECSRMLLKGHFLTHHTLMTTTTHIWLNQQNNDNHTSYSIALSSSFLRPFAINSHLQGIKLLRFSGFEFKRLQEIAKDKLNL